MQQLQNVFNEVSTEETNDGQTSVLAEILEFKYQDNETLGNNKEIIPAR